MKDLVYLTTQDISRSKPVASTRTISEEFVKRHSHVLRTVDNLIKDESSSFFTQPKIGVSEYLDNSGKSNKEYLLTRDQFMFVVMGFTGAKANKIKESFIKQFNFMEHELLVRSDTRVIGKSYRHSLTDSISNNLEDNTSHKKFAYGNYTKLVYKRVLGVTVKKYKETNGLKVSDNVRDHLSIDQLEKVQAMESKIAVLIEGFTHLMSDKEAYSKVKELI